MSTPTKLPRQVSSPASVKELRKSIAGLAGKATADVEAVRNAFTSGIAPLQTVGSGSITNFITSFGEGGMASAVVESTARLGLSTSIVGTTVSPPKPELDFVEIISDRTVGTLDSFYARLVLSISNEDAKKISHIRVLRSTLGPVKGLSKPAFSALMETTVSAARTKSTEQIFNTARQIDSVGVGNKLTDFVADDTFSSQRAVISSGTLRPVPAAVNTNRGTSQAGLLQLNNVDRSVLENVSFYVNQRTVTSAESIRQPLVVSQREGVNVLQGSAITSAGSVIETGNSMGFYEIAKISIAKGRGVGGFIEIEHVDPSIVFGSSYSYYVVAVAVDGTESPRSRLVTVNVVRNTPPASPEVYYSVVAGRPRFSIRCSGSFVDHVEIFRQGGDVPESVIVLSSRAALIDKGVAAKTNSGFYHIGDVGTGVDRSSTFVDRNVTGGDRLSYRFYTVDSFGLKSATPFSCSLVIPDHGNRIPLSLPSITAEQGVGGRKVDISISCDDPRVTQFVVGRRDLTTGQHSFHLPTQPDYFTLGSTDPKRSRSRIGPRLNATSVKAWSGVFTNVSGNARFSDTTVEYDRVYQYAVYGVDVRGNRTSNVPTRPLTVTTKPVADAPIAISASVIISDGFPLGVRIDWTGGTSDFSPNELIGDQDVLAATIRRSVYQVERREVGFSNWEPMPATTASYFVDPVSTATPPKFRPTYVVPSAQYDYRVIAMQSGAFLSTYTDPVRVVVVPEVIAPAMVWVRSTPSSIRPFHVVVSWNYDGIFVDRWEIARASTNKIFGSKIFSMDSKDARALTYETIASVTRESSRGHGVSANNPIDEKLRTGNRFFIDDKIDLANSYFYRVRAFDRAGKFSDWTYAGISLVDSPHDRKMFTAMSEKEKALLSVDPRPIAKWRNG